MRRFPAVIAMMLLATLAAPVSAEPDRERVFAVLAGETYTYADLELSDAEMAHRRKDQSGKTLEVSLYWEAVTKLREAVLTEAARRYTPGCAIEPTPEQLERFVAWWRTEAIRIRDELVAVHRLNHPRGELRLEPPLDSLDDMDASDPWLAAAAERKLNRWLVDRCLYREFGGGRVHRIIGPYRFVEPGEDVVAIHVAYAGYPYPVVTSNGHPLDAYRMAVERAEAEGVVTFPDPDIRDDVYHYLRRDDLRTFPAGEEAAAVEDAYWLHPVEPYDP